MHAQALVIKVKSMRRAYWNAPVYIHTSRETALPPLSLLDANTPLSCPRGAQRELCMGNREVESERVLFIGDNCASGDPKLRLVISCGATAAGVGVY